ncbi:family 43 glycosylhydrolase [Ferruginibacter paludis]|uniref:family 43 glycosylhydrolase n=1 Tax=Ferruginibacter paludis TaxID=1310417 RepID=UPI0025B51722|nr:family 43 glycosylhydrolase [Ferruginibacter paludis]MDN3656859.1 family 43 glycosylhydrolase [Ferruginibacter paludis]
MMQYVKRICLLPVFFCLISNVFSQSNKSPLHIAPAPLYRDPIYDGAADPVVIYSKAKKEWWMFYTQRRANVQSANVAFCYGTDIGVATSSDHGQSWVYKGTPALEFEEGRNTFWAPDIIVDKGLYHMFVVYIRGVRNDWGGDKVITHYTSKDLWKWKHEGDMKLSSGSVIDPSFYKMPDGKWHVWYKDETKGSITMTGESSDLKNWTLSDKPAIGGKPHEGPKMFRFKDSYWMITDEWAGQRVYRSADAITWEKQGRILDKNGTRPQDTPTGAHADVVVTGDKAYIFYFTHPGRKVHSEGELDKDGCYSYSNKRSVIQVAEIIFKDGTLDVIRDEPFDFWLPDM